MAKQNKKNTWIKPRHRRWWNFANGLLKPIVDGVYCMDIVPFEDNKGQYLVLANHQTPFDQFYLSRMLKGNIYFVCTEDLLSNKFVGGIIKHTIEPIPIQKGTMDFGTIKACAKVAKEGGSIAISPEGNRTYSGETVDMSPAIASLARKMGMPIMLYHIEGGYGVQPRWSDVTRRGKMRAFVSRVIEPEEYNNLTDEELFAIIKEDLYVNEAKVDGSFKHKKLAEYLERAIYTCPDCGLSVLESHGDLITCKKCGKTVKYLPTKELVGVDCDFPHRFVLDWYNAQTDYINGLDPTLLCEEPIYKDCATMSQVVPYEKKILLAENADILLYGNRIEVCGEKTTSFLFDDTTAVTVLGKNKLNIYHDGKIYQLKGNKRFCALKYVHIFTRYINVKKGENHALL